MNPSDSRRLFEQSFDTFKVFDNLTLANSSFDQQAFPTSIWQILQHLLAWQEHQLAQLQGTVQAESFDEKSSWDSERIPSSEEVLQAAVTKFKKQLIQMQAHANQAERDIPEVLRQGLILQEVALHLSFHVGEVVLMRRFQGSYPLPAHMQEFLQA